MLSEELSAIEWGGGGLRLLDQRLLPETLVWLKFDTVSAVAQAISDLVVRGAPAIGISAAYGSVLAARNRMAHDKQNWRTGFAADMAALAASRPTAVNLMWAVRCMQEIADAAADDEVVDRLLQEAQRIHRADIEANRRMGEYGAALIEPRSGVLTHCNAGALATGGYGTALGVIRAAHAQKRLLKVYASETRPWFQGARLTAWELQQSAIHPTLIIESAAASLMAQGLIQWVIVGADRIAANGDVANKIGTYMHAVAARHHGVRFMVAAPLSTIDLETPSGADIPIEERDPAEVTTIAGKRFAPEGVAVANPVFDVTPAELVSAIVTEQGVLENPDRTGIAALFKRPG